MKVELFYTEGCGKCAAVRESLKATAQAIPGVEWREVNIMEEIDYAVELGVLSLPAIAIDKELVFTSLPTPPQLSEALRKRGLQRA
jgi:thioredoxin 1